MNRIPHSVFFFINETMAEARETAPTWSTIFVVENTSMHEVKIKLSC